MGRTELGLGGSARLVGFGQGGLGLVFLGCIVSQCMQRVLMNQDGLVKSGQMGLAGSGWEGFGGIVSQSMHAKCVG